MNNIKDKTNIQNVECIVDIEGLLNPLENVLRIAGSLDVKSEQATIFVNTMGEQDLEPLPYAVYFENEKDLVKGFLKFMDEKGYRHITNYNTPFDLQQLFAKAMKYEIKTKFFSCYFSDLMQFTKCPVKLFSWNKPFTLAAWSEYLFGEKKSLDSALIPALLLEKKQGWIRALVEHNCEDLYLTLKLLKRIQLVLNGDIET